MSENRVGDHVYALWSRDLLETITLLIGRVGKYLDIPRILEDGADISELWHGAAYQRHLRSFVAVGGDLARDLLLSLEFFSGAHHAQFGVYALCVFANC